MTERNDQWSWDGVNKPYQQEPQPGQYGAAPPPFEAGENPYADGGQQGSSTSGHNGQPPQYGQQAPQYGQPPQYGQQAPQYGAPGQYGAPPYYGAPPQYGQQPPASYRDQLASSGAGPTPQFAAGALKPGIVALRPLNFGEFFDGAFRSIQHNPQVMFGLSLVVAVVLSLLQVLLIGGAYWDILSDPFGTSVMSPTAALGFAGGAMASGVLSVVATIVLNGILVISVSQSVLGRKVAIGEVWKQVKGAIWRLIGVTLLVSAMTFAGLLVGMLVIGIFIGTLASAFDSAGGVAMIVILVLLMVAGIFALAAFFYVRFVLATAVIVMERAPVIESLRRSWRLTKGFFWRNGFVLLLGTIIVGTISSVFTLPIGMLAGWIASTGTAGVWAAGVLTVAITALISALTTPFIAALSALLYVDLRMRKEGLDVELIRAASS